MKKAYLIAAVVALLTFSYCIQPPDYPVEPVIEYIGVSKNLLRQGEGYSDSLLVTFSFTDGDGDIGYPANDPTPSVFIRDSRDGFEKPPLQLPYVEPQGASNGISGEITVKLPTTCCIFISPQGIPFACEEVPFSVKFDTFFYYIRIRDRAGNLSNEIQTEPIQLQCH